MRIIRLALTAIILSGVIFCVLKGGLVTFGTLGTLLVLFLLFRFTNLPYKIIAGTFRLIPPKSDSCSIVNPFITLKSNNDDHAIITVPDIAITKWRCEHERTHVKQVRRYILKYGDKGVYIFLFVILKDIIWYGYADSPLELEANEAANKAVRR